MATDAPAQPPRTKAAARSGAAHRRAKRAEHLRRKADRRFDEWAAEVERMAASLSPDDLVWKFLAGVEGEARKRGVFDHLRDHAVGLLHVNVNGQAVRKPSLPENMPLGVKRLR